MMRCRYRRPDERTGETEHARLFSRRDDLRFVYMSGFTELATDAASTRRPTLLRKPFSREDLARFVRRALDAA